MSELQMIPDRGPGEVHFTGTYGEGDGRPVVVVERSPGSRGPLDVLLRLLAVLALLLVVALLGGMLFAVIGLTSAVGGLGGGLGSLGGAVGGAGAAAQAAAQRAAQDLADRADPAHPPRGTLYQDTEFDELRRVAVGEGLFRAGGYNLTLARVEKRQDATEAGQAQYAVVHRRLESPRQTRVGPVLVREDWDEADYFLYKGESFRIGRAYYKVNWVSVDRQEAAIARYRAVDGLPVSLKFGLD